MKNSLSPVQRAESIYINSSKRYIEKVSGHIGALVAASSIAFGGVNLIQNKHGDGVQPANTILSVANQVKRSDHYTYQDYSTRISSWNGNNWEYNHTQLSSDPAWLPISIVKELGNMSLFSIGSILIFLGLRNKKIQLKKGEIFDTDIKGIIYTTKIFTIDGDKIRISYTNQSTGVEKVMNVSKKTLEKMVVEYGIIHPR
ncbi:hypothetical protein H7169_02090 [Candidatus Gracilibacteria bacterium]|nr:hypothetical protein [Candidatus Gracilibacteria bacterium]